MCILEKQSIVQIALHRENIATNARFNFIKYDAWDMMTHQINRKEKSNESSLDLSCVLIPFDVSIYMHGDMM